MPLPSPVDWIARAAATRPDAAALIGEGRSLTYGDLDDVVARTVTGLARLGVDSGGRVGVVMRRDVQTVATLWAIWRLGAVAVVVDEASPLLAHGDDVTRSAWGLDVMTEPLDAEGLAPASVRETPAPGSEHTWVPTSGTTGAPRPVRLTHANIAAAVAASQARLGNGSEDRWLLALPLFHVGGLAILWRSAAAGGTVVLMDRFDAMSAADAMRTGRVSLASVVPTMLHRILEADMGPYAEMRAVLVGGAATPPSLVERALAAGLPVLATYGMTETCAQAATVDPAHPSASSSTVGYPLDGFEITIDHPNREGFGEILISGPAVSPGYAFEPPRVGPHRTGDLGRIDTDGRLIVAGRCDDVIITGGENVRPGAVEAALSRAPEVADIVVYGLPDVEWGQLVAATVVVGADIAGSGILDGIAGELLPPSHRPRRWRTVSAMPLLPNGKIDRAAVAAQHAAESDR